MTMTTLMELKYKEATAKKDKPMDKKAPQPMKKDKKGKGC